MHTNICVDGLTDGMGGSVLGPAPSAGPVECAYYNRHAFIYLYIYIYIYREREICVYIYIMYTYIYIYIILTHNIIYYNLIS